MVSVPPDENSPDDIPSFLREALGLLQDDEIFVFPHILRIIVLIDDDRIAEVCRRRDAGSEITQQIRDWELVFITRVDLELKIDRSFGLFNKLDGTSKKLSETLVSEGLFSGSDLVKLGAERLTEHFGVAQPVARRIIKNARTLNDFDGDRDSRWG